jgi:hypothetical protein
MQTKQINNDHKVVDNEVVPETKAFQRLIEGLAKNKH